MRGAKLALSMVIALGAAVLLLAPAGATERCVLAELFTATT
jgi:hypothetical protein